MGTGTTAVAAINTKRNYLGFEINKNYCKLIDKRIKDNKKEKSLFEKTIDIKEKKILNEMRTFSIFGEIA